MMHPTEDKTDWQLRHLTFWGWQRAEDALDGA